MKTVIFTGLLTFAAFLSFGQDTTKTEIPKEMPPISMLKAKPGKRLYIKELPHETNFKVFNHKGKLVKEGHGKWIELTKLKKGSYFIKFDGKTELFEKPKK